MATHSRPVIACSFGKDSIVMLHVFLEMRWPVLFFKEPFCPEKREYANMIISRWGLVVYDYAPSGVQMADGNGLVDVVRMYQIGEQSLAVATGIEKSELGEFLCGMDDLVLRPLGTFEFKWDVALVGHKGSDVDPVRGQCGVALDIKRNPRSATLAYPLRNWTDDDVWDYIESNDIPIDSGRYEKKNGTWASKQDRSTNQDYFRACVKCVDRSEPSIVKCPKTGLLINNQSHLLVWNNEPKDYLRHQAKT